MLQLTTVFKTTVNRCVLSRRRKIGRLHASMTEVGRLFRMAGTAELKTRPPYYAVLVRGAWTRGDDKVICIICFALCFIARMSDETDAKKILTASHSENWRRPPGIQDALVVCG